MDFNRPADIIAEIYEATIKPHHWNHVVNLIGTLTGSKAACLYFTNRSGEATSTMANWGLQEPQSASLNCYSEFVDDLLTIEDGPASYCAGHSQTLSGENSAVEPSSDFFQNWMQPNEISHLSGVKFGGSESYRASLIIFRDEASKFWSRSELEVIEEILPHLQRALNIHFEFFYLRQSQDALIKGLDELVVGLVLFDFEARPVFVNSAARAIAESHPEIIISAGKLSLRNREDDQKLQQALINAAQIISGEAGQSDVAFGVHSAESGALLPLLITPMRTHLAKFEAGHEEARVALFVSDSKANHPMSSELLASVYGLTPSEAQVAIRIANGESIDEIAKLTHHSVHTIRSQLKSVFRKTGVSRQSELIKMLLMGPFAERRQGLRGV